MPTTQSGCPRCGTAVPREARFCPSCGSPTARLSPGETLDGKYEILDKIGEGGMGEVFRARHLHLDEIRIIKVTKPDALAEGPEPRRFQQEARLATLVRHPNVAALYDFSRLPDGSYYMVWEYIDGITLEEWLRRHGPLPLARALDVARQVLDGLSQIHAQGIVHRDLSPDNILLSEAPDGRLHAKIIDLGIAKRVTAESLRMTSSGMFMGKLKYCSPEQAGALAPGESVDHRSDLYSFGVLFYEMLMGKAPFEGETPESYLGKHLHTPPPDLDTSRLPPLVGPRLSGIVKKALEKRRERRFQTAREFAAALAQLSPGATGPEEEAETVLMETRRRRSAVPWIAAGMAVLAAAVGVFALRPKGPEPLSPAAARGTVARATPAREEVPDEITVTAPRVIEHAVQDAGRIRPHPEYRGSSAPAATAAIPPPKPPDVPTAPPGLTPVSIFAPARASPESVPPPRSKHAATPEGAKRVFEQWKTQPVQGRARTAIEIAEMANRIVAVYPDDPLAREIRERLPQAFKAGAESSWNSTRPFLGVLFYRAYKQLTFAPPDPDLEARAEQEQRRAGQERFSPKRRRRP